MRGDNSHSYFLQKGFQEGVNIDLSSNEETNPKKLIKGRVDVVIQSQESLNYRLDLLGSKYLSLVSDVAISQAESAEHCMALSLETNAETVKKIRNGFEQWQKISTMMFLLFNLLLFITVIYAKITIFNSYTIL